VLERLQRYLLDAGKAWDDADPAQRNRLARALFEAVLVRGRHVDAVRPRPEFQPYFVLAKMATTPVPANGSAPLGEPNGKAPGALSHRGPKERARGDSNPRSRP
jgi:hypothetical protein